MAFGSRWAFAERLMKMNADSERKDRAEEEEEGEGEDDGCRVDVLPRLVKPRAPPGDSIGALVRRAATRKALESLNDDVLDDMTLKRLWFVLQDIAEPAEEEEEEDAELVVSYDNLCRERERLKDRMPQLAALTASRMLHLPRDNLGRISARAIFQFAHRLSRSKEAEIDLRSLDGDSTGYITSAGLHKFLHLRVESVRILSPLFNKERAFLKAFIRIAAQRFLFYESRAAPNRISVANLLGSSVLSELIDLGQVPPHTDPYSRALALHHWFSIPNIRRIYNCFLDLDGRKLGSLTAHNLLRFPSSQPVGTPGLTRTFTTRLIDVTGNKRTSHGQRREGTISNTNAIATTTINTMALEDFTNFWIAWEDRRSQQSLRYFLRIFDIQGRGKLSHSDVKFFLADIQLSYRSLMPTDADVGEDENYPFNVEDVADEMFDIVNPRDGTYITIRDLERCQQAHTFITCLADVYGFIAYDQREQNMHAAEDDYDEEQQ